MSDNSPSKVRIVGRVADRAGVERVELVSGNVLLSTAFPTALRSNARRVFPACPAGVTETSDVPLELDKLGQKDKVLSLYAVRSGGSRYKVGEVPGDVFSMIVHVESRTPVQWDASNYIAGWAFSRSSSVDVSVLAGKKLLAKTRADGLREDVGKSFPLWPSATHSAFGIPLHMATMPCGHYHLNLQFSDESGHRKLLLGPEVVNDLPIGKVIAQADRVVHPNHFKAYDAMEGTAFEYQLVWWLREMRVLPVGSRFYPFGNDRVKSADGWVAGPGTTVTLEAGQIRLSGKESHVSLVSPDWDEPL